MSNADLTAHRGRPGGPPSAIPKAQQAPVGDRKRPRRSRSNAFAIIGTDRASTRGRGPRPRAQPRRMPEHIDAARIGQQPRRRHHSNHDDDRTRRSGYEAVPAVFVRGSASAGVAVGPRRDRRAASACRSTRRGCGLAPTARGAPRTLPTSDPNLHGSWLTRIDGNDRRSQHDWCRSTGRHAKGSPAKYPD